MQGAKVNGVKVNNASANLKNYYYLRALILASPKFTGLILPRGILSWLNSHRKTQFAGPFFDRRPKFWPIRAGQIRTGKVNNSSIHIINVASYNMG